MTIDEKLQHFYEVSLDEAREDAAQAIQEHKEHLARTLEDHKQTSRQNAEAEIKQRPAMSVVKSTRLFLPNRSLSEETCPENRKN